MRIHPGEQTLLRDVFISWEISPKFHMKQNAPRGWGSPADFVLGEEISAKFRSSSIMDFALCKKTDGFIRVAKRSLR